MRKVLKPSFSNLFQIDNDLREILEVNQSINSYNSFTALIFISFILCLSGLYHISFLFVGLSIISSLGFSYLRLGHISKRIRMKREAPKRAIEREKIKMLLYIDNRSDFSINHYKVVDRFNGSQIGVLSFDGSKPLISHRRSKVRYHWICDGGMGKKSFSSFTLILSDSLGIFNFKIHYEAEEEIEVYPKLESIPEIQTLPNNDSFHYGELDVDKRGESVNFYGIRDYRPGDPVKRINWRQTAKQLRPILNLFERNVNKTLLFLFQNHQNLHCGHGETSTQEYLKDIILGLANHQVSNGNQLRVVSCDSASPWGAEPQFIQQLEFYLMSLELSSSAGGQNFVRRSLLDLENSTFRGSTVLYFTPIVSTDLFHKNFQELIEFSSRGVPIIFIGVNGFSHLDKFFSFSGLSPIKGHLDSSLKLQRNMEEKLRGLSIPYYFININESGVCENFKKAVNHFERK